MKLKLVEYKKIKNKLFNGEEWKFTFNQPLDTNEKIKQAQLICEKYKKMRQLKK